MIVPYERRSIMVAVSLIGALLFLAGVVYMAASAINRGRMSDPRPEAEHAPRVTLEPQHRGLGFLGLKSNWPGIAMMAAGALLLLALTL
jgi:hypothetical protein